MTIAQRFMDMARSRLPADAFEPIYADAVAAERKAMSKPASVRVEQKVEKPAVAARIEAHLTGKPQPPAPEAPHIAERLEERLDIQADAVALAQIARMIDTNAPGIQFVKRSMQTVAECVVPYGGKHFVVIYNMSARKLITAYPKTKKKPKRMAGRPRDARQNNDIMEYDA